MIKICRMLTCTSERRRRISIIIIIIGKKNKEITCSGLCASGRYLRNGKRYSSSVFTRIKGRVVPPTVLNDVSVVVIVSEIL